MFTNKILEETALGYRLASDNIFYDVLKFETDDINTLMIGRYHKDGCGAVYEFRISWGLFDGLQEPHFKVSIYDECWPSFYDFSKVVEKIHELSERYKQVSPKIMCEALDELGLVNFNKS